MRFSISINSDSSASDPHSPTPLFLSRDEKGVLIKYLVPAPTPTRGASRRGENLAPFDPPLLPLFLYPPAASFASPRHTPARRRVTPGLTLAGCSGFPGAGQLVEGKLWPSRWGQQRGRASGQKKRRKAAAAAERCSRRRLLLGRGLRQPENL